jgi:hypothetical protein
MNKVVWSLDELRSDSMTQTTYKNSDKWIIARPENFKPKYLSIFERLYRSYLVFIGKADCFIWPEDYYN